MKKFSFLSKPIFTWLLTYKVTFLVIALLFTAIQISAQNSDVAPPEINDFSFTSSIIDTTHGPQNVVVSVRATDNDRGVNLIAVRFRSASGNQFVNAFINSQQRVSGDSRNGIYIATAVFPQYCKAGVWNVLGIETRDEANNYKTLSTAEIATLGFATELQVISNNEDVSAPEIGDLRFDKSAVDTTESAQTVTVTVRATDSLSGVRTINVYFYQPSNDYLIATELTVRQIVSGDGKNGVYTGTITFPQGTDAGVWYAAASVSDAIGNQKTISTSDLTAHGLATEIQVVGATTTDVKQKTRKRARII